MAKLFKNPTATNAPQKDMAKEEPAPPTNLIDVDKFAAEQVADAEGFKDLIEEEVEAQEDLMDVRPVEKVNLEDLNESTLLKYPIVAKSLNDAPMAVIKPATSDICFHWVFYDRNATGNTAKVVSQNLQRYRFWGFEFATLADIEGGEDALGEGMVDDGKIINYDTVLMKINKVRLMQHYKSNLIQSLEMTNKALARAIRSAEADIKRTAQYRKAMEIYPQAKVEFYSPTDNK